MRWPDVIEAITQACLQHPTTALIYGEKIRAAGSAEFAVPSLDYTLVGDAPLDEIWEPIIIQFDQFVQDEEQLIASNRALRALFDHDVPVRILGVYMWAQYEPGPANLAAPATEGYYGQAARFRFTPIQERFLR